MKRWVTMTLSVAALAGVGYLGETAYLMGQERYQDIENRLATLSVQVSDLNDQLIAASRDEKQDSPTDSNQAVSQFTLSMAQVFPQHWLKQSLQLAQSQLELDQNTSSVNAFESAKNTLNLIKSNLNALETGHAISMLTAGGLARAIDVDLKMIDSQAQTQRQEIQLLDRRIAQLQMTLDAMARQGPSMQMTTTVTNPSAQGIVVPSTDLSFSQRISRLFVIEKPTQNVRENMLERGLVCREVTLTLGLARQALAQGQSDRVMQLLAEGTTQLATIVDPAAKQMQASIAALSVPAHPKLKLTALQWVPAEMLSAKSMSEVTSTPTALADSKTLVPPKHVTAS